MSVAGLRDLESRNPEVPRVHSLPVGEIRAAWWTEPLPLAHQRDLRFFAPRKTRNTERLPRMVPLALGDGVTGYSACLLGSLLYLHAHVAGEDVGFYRAYPSDAIWLYFAVAPDERIIDIWMRTTQLVDNKALLVSFISEAFAPVNLTWKSR